jgi:cytochrome c biogenesis protein CcmG, thiol:disulfide interchange protein DsbE
MNRVVLVAGILITVALVVILSAGLGKDPQHIDSPLIGKQAPDFALKAVGTGDTIDLTQFRGKPLVVNFWATWCRPCYEEHPVLVSNAQLLQGQVQFLGVVFQDQEEKIQQFLNERGSAYPTLVDQAGKTAIAYGVGGVPETFFLNKDGKVVAKFEGPIDPDSLQQNVRKAMTQ